MRKLILLIILICSVSFAKQSKTIFVMKRQSSLGVENIGFVLEADKITATSNSTFAFKSYPLKLGLFEMKVSNELKKKISDLSKIKIKEDTTMESPHNVMVYVNGNKVPVSSPLYPQTIELIKSVFAENLIPKDGIVLKSLDEISKIKCEEVKDNICIFKYGYLYR